MTKHLTRREASALAAIATAALFWAPISNADDPADCDQLPADQVQQCQQQKGAGIANEAIDDAKDGADRAKQAADQAKQASDQAKQASDQAKQATDQAKQAADQAKQGADQAKQGAGQGQKAIDLSDKNCWLINGVPTMWTPALSTGPGQTAVPCYSAYGLTPH
jgi:methyl-accepting chemotaxis protein